MTQQTGKIFLVAGAFIIVAGFMIYFFHDYLKWIGKLPGDIRIEKENFNFYFPITTMILFSVLISLLLMVYKKFF